MIGQMTKFRHGKRDDVQVVSNSVIGRGILGVFGGNWTRNRWELDVKGMRWRESIELL